MYKDETLEIEKLFLNPKNYRIDFERYDTVDEVVERLYEDEDIIGMIKDIVSFGGLYPNDIPIVIPKNDSSYTVIEGNRRILAIKSLLGLISPPARYKKEVESLKSKMSQEKLDYLRKIRAVVYDEKDSDYLKIIANKHSTISYERWGQISQWHFFKDTYVSNNKDLEATSKELGKSKTDVSNYIRFHNLISYIRSLPYWDQRKLRNEIEKNKLKPTKFTRPLGSKSVLNELNIEFRGDLELKIPDNNKAEFDYILCMYAEASLIKDKSDDDYIYTRSEPSQVIDLIKGWKEAYERDNPPQKETLVRENRTKEEQTAENMERNESTDKENHQSKQTNEKPNEQRQNSRSPRKHPKFFRQLKVSKDIKDQNLEHIAAEISKIVVKNFPLSTLLLTRSLIENSLIYRLRQKNEWNGFMTEMENYVNRFGQKSDRSSTFTLDDIVKYCIKRVENLFAGKREAELAKKALNKIQEKNGIRKYLNDMTHESLATPSPEHVQLIADDIRQLIEKILLEVE